MPLAGNALALTETPLELLSDGAAQAGPIFRLRLFGTPMTVIAGQGAAALVRSGAEGPLTREASFEAFATETSVDVFSREGVAHEEARVLLQRGYSRQIFGQFVPEIMRRLARRTQSLRTRARTPMVELCAELAVRAMMTALTPVDLTEVVPDVARFGHDVMSVVVGVRPALVFKHPEYRLAKARLDAAIDAIVARHARPEERDEARTYMVDAFLDARTADGGVLDARAARGACLYALCGASSYVGPLGAFLLYEVTRDQELRARVLAEVDAGFAAGPFDPLRLRQMPALRAAYFETLRRYPIVFGLAYRASRDFDFAGHRVPRGELVLVTPVPGHFDEGHFPNPFQFEASRFESRAPLNPAVYAPFGMAPRTCLAAGVVEMLTLSVVASILRRVELSLVHPSYRAEAKLRPLPQAPDGLPLLIGNMRSPEPASAHVARAVDLSDPFGRGLATLPLAEPNPVLLSAGRAIEAPRADGALFVILGGSVDDATGTTYGAGDVIGATGLVGRAPTGSTRVYEANETTRLLVVSGASFAERMRESDLMARELGRLVQWQYLRDILHRALPDLDVGSLHGVIPEVALRSFGSGEAVFEQGEPAEHMYAVVSGELVVVRTQADGSHHEVASLTSGELFGEMGVLQRRPRAATVRVREGQTALVLSLPRLLLEQLFEGSPTAREKIAATSSDRLVQWIESLETRHAREARSV